MRYVQSQYTNMYRGITGYLETGRKAVTRHPSDVYRAATVLRRHTAGRARY